MPSRGPGFAFVNVLNYFGGLMAIGAMSLFMTLGFEAMGTWGLLAIGTAYLVGSLKVADHFKTRKLPVPAGLMGTLAIAGVEFSRWLKAMWSLWLLLTLMSISAMAIAVWIGF